MSEKSAKAEAVTHEIGTPVKFKTGRAGSEYTAKVTGYDGQFLVTTDTDGKVRKVRPGAAVAV